MPQTVVSSFGQIKTNQPLSRVEKAQLAAAVEDYYKSTPDAELGAFIYSLLSQFIMMKSVDTTIDVV